MIKRVNISDVLMDFINRNKIVNLNIIGIIDNEKDAEIYSDSEEKPRGIVVRYGYMNYIYTEDDAFLEEALETLFKDNYYGFSGVYRPLAEKIIKRYQVNWESRCALYYYPKRSVDLYCIKNKVSSIDIKDAEIIDEFYTYRDEESLKEIKKNINYRETSAIYANDEIASWVMIHNDDSMGIMYTKEKYRGLGYAVDVTLDLMSRIIRKGKIPYLQINEHNGMSPGLAAKCGFITHGYADWFGIIAGKPKEIVDACNESRNRHLKNIPQAVDYEGEKLYGMYISAASFDKNIGNIEGLKTEKVTEADGIRTWCNVLADGLRVEGNRRKAFIDGVFNGISDEKNGYNVYLARYNGKPIGTVSFINLENVGKAVNFISAIPEIKNEDFVKSMLVEAARKEIDWEGETLITAVNEDYHGFLKNMGFADTYCIE